VLGLRSLVAADCGVLDALVLLQASVAVGLDRRVMDEYIWRSIVGHDKAVALIRVEPLHCSLSHCALLPERSAGSTSVHPGAARPPVPPWEGSGMQAPAVRIRRRCDTSTKFDYNRSHLTPSPALPLLLTRRRRQARSCYGVAGQPRPRRCGAPGGMFTRRVLGGMLSKGGDACIRGV